MKKILKKLLVLLSIFVIMSPIFNPISSILNKDKKNSYLIYQDMVLKGLEPYSIIVLLANKFNPLFLLASIKPLNSVFAFGAKQKLTNV